MTKQNLTPERLRELLDYDPETGILCWRETRGGRMAGSVAGTLKPKGHLAIGIDGYIYLAHRLIWLHVYGKWPDGQIDHIDHNGSHNAMCNLRDVSGSVNSQNQIKSHRGSKTGFLGVYPNKLKFQAMIRSNGKLVHIGLFDTPEEAHAAYVEAKRILHAGCTL